MIALKANCDRTYHASRTSGKRELHVIDLVAWHCEEAGTALSAASWFANPAPPPPEGDGPAGSAHLCVDDNICYRTLNNNEIPWGASSSFGANTHGIHIEQAGFAKWLGITWLLHRRTLKRCAFKTAQHCDIFEIPVRFLFASNIVDAVRAGKRPEGITTHAEITKASKILDPANAWKYDHTDPGLFYPRRYVMRLVRDYYAQLSV
jgi:hypothetical protein